ncbi:MAG: hypothetical protein K8W52_21330 [Deltaproteobacteria bacterium]|nr:hypothetical protein [Deltaproteobacteria bacterium]
MSDPTVPVYVVTAYRWGRTNEHAYTCFAGVDREAAIRAAKEECHGRGLKYGVEVVEFPSDETVAYFSSSAEAQDARGPTESVDRLAAERIGQAILSAFQRGVRYAPSGQWIKMPNGAAVETLTEVAVELPDWIKSLCEAELDMARKLIG